MIRLDIAHQRLHNEHLAGAPLSKPEDVVQWLCAVQSQDYAGAKWAIAQRTTGVTSAQLDQLFNDGKILRTHIMRPTWHFVTPADIRWLLKLTSPRVHAANAYYYRQLELDDAVFQRSNATLAQALRGGGQLTRAEIAQLYKNAGINASGLRLVYLIMRAELDAVICSGALRGKQFTYASFDERVPSTKMLDHAEALAELTRRYFTSHGPALAQDFTWWSGLTAADVKAGIEMVKPELVAETVDGKTYWLAAPIKTAVIKNPTIHLLPNYDEFVVAYKDHSASFDSAVLNNLQLNASALLAYIIVRNGHMIGGWKRTIQKKEVTITTNLLIQLNEAEQAALTLAADQYGQFMEMPVTVLSATASQL